MDSLLHNRSSTHRRHTSTPKILHPPLPMPPAPTNSDLSVDKDLLQRWSTNNSPNGTPSHRSQSHIKRHASFDSPREVPLPSPSLSSLSPGTLPSSALPFFSNTNLNSTPSVNTAAPNNRPNHSPLPARPQDVVDYFPLQPRPSTIQSSPSSSSSSQQSSIPSRNGSRRFSDFTSENRQQDCRSSCTESDWTSQTSPSPPACGEDDQKRNSPPPTDLVPTLPHASQFDALTTRLGPSAMTQSSQPPSLTDTTVNGTWASITTTPIFPNTRPYSLPDARSHSKLYASSNQLGSVPTRFPPHQPGAGLTAVEPTANPVTWSDRNSSASLPLPMQIPYYTLPRAADVPPTEQIGPGSPILSGGDAGPPRNGTQPHIQSNYPYHHPPLSHPESSSSSSSSSSYGSYNLRSPSMDRPNPRMSPPPVPPVTKPTSADTTRGQTQAELQRASSLRRPVSPFRAPQPRPTTANIAPPASSSSSTAMPRPLSSGGAATYSTSAFSSYPAPEPPIILAPSSDGPGQPYDPFLSHAPPPADSWIQVETTQGEYRLNVRLPGFKRDGITLATKRRRILHVVADSWENGGGHFERRISFGYDADLVQVRAEFDGEMLRISIPRRLPPVNLWQISRPGPLGRSG